LLGGKTHWKAKQVPTLPDRKNQRCRTLMERWLVLRGEEIVQFFA